MTEYAVEIQPDFLERQAKALPIAAVAELIWNGLDADATSVTIDFIDDEGASKNPKMRNLSYGIECDSEKPRDFIGARDEAAGVVRFFRAAEEAAEDAGFS
jgi:hypothetical protein